MDNKNTPIVFRSSTGSVLAFSAGIFFYLVCMVMPLIGPAGSRVEHAGQNKATFVTLLVLTLLLAAASTYSRQGRRKLEGGALPWFSMGLSALCLVMLVIVLLNGFSI